MLNQKRNLFRPEALERLASPERLDQLMQVVTPKEWLGLTALGFLVATGLSWSFWGRLPITLTGRGVLIVPQQITEVQLPLTGQIQQVSVQVGDRVRKGQVIGVIDRPDLREQLRQQQIKLATLQRQEQQQKSVEDQRTSAERASLQQQRQTLEQRIQNARTIAPRLRTQEMRTLTQQERTLQERLQEAQKLEPVLRSRVVNRQRLLREGAIAGDLVLQAEADYRDNTNQILDLQTQIQQLQSQRVALDQQQGNDASQVLDLQAQVQELESRERLLAQQTLANRVDRTNQRQEVRQQITQLTVQLKQQSQILSPYTGQVVEVSAQPGQVLNQGMPLAVLDVEGVSRQLVGIAYLPLKEGALLKPNMSVQITPDTVKRQEFGGILGKVKSFSSFPVTRQTVVKTVGNGQLADSLLSQGGQIEVLITLEPDTTNRSQYRWSSSQGPELTFPSGTPASVQVIVGERAPISFVLPFLRSVTGLE
ncbi:MAG: NHLP bacteriocin system secretion protein [Leptolyngbyaceae cyanobacterium bins.59]|nr:NHLP bacteriocin system secretion protein [Leptolyngbyaceae cyanobacterium bins.59]